MKGSIDYKGETVGFSVVYQTDIPERFEVHFSEPEKYGITNPVIFEEFYVSSTPSVRFSNVAPDANFLRNMAIFINENAEEIKRASIKEAGE